MTHLRARALSVACAIAAFLPRSPGSAAPVQASAMTPVPEFTQTGPADWINSRPLSLAQLAGRPVLIEFWTFECINCLRSLDWMKHAVARFGGQGLTVIAVHTPELARERDPDNVRDAVERLGIEYPVMLDPGLRYWNALDNHYWPAFYLVGADGTLLAQAIGEMHVGESRAEQFEQRIQDALRAVNGER
jgi:thiol-disulfide isomerase/thioredoxin